MAEAPVREIAAEQGVAQLAALVDEAQNASQRWPASWPRTSSVLLVPRTSVSGSSGYRDERAHLHEAAQPAAAADLRADVEDAAPMPRISFLSVNSKAKAPPRLCGKSRKTIR